MTKQGLHSSCSGEFVLRLLGGYCLILLLAPTSLLAQPAETQPIRITAEQARMDDREGISRYSGNVVVVRGDFIIHAEELSIFAPGRRPIRIEASGSPARAEGSAVSGSPLVATASRIVYNLETETLSLEGRAEVSTRSGNARADFIEYEVAFERIHAQGTHESKVEIFFVPSDP